MKNLAQTSKKSRREVSRAAHVDGYGDCRPADRGQDEANPDCAGGSLGPEIVQQSGDRGFDALFAIEPVPVAPYACGAYDDPGVRRAKSVAKENPRFGKERVLPFLGGAASAARSPLAGGGPPGASVCHPARWGRPRLVRPSRSSLPIVRRLNDLARPQDPPMLLSQRTPRMCIGANGGRKRAHPERVPGTVTAADRSRPSGSSAP